MVFWPSHLPLHVPLQVPEKPAVHPASQVPSQVGAVHCPEHWPLHWIAAFALFRLFDIWKPPPVRQLEALPGGWGINLDDVMAGVYAALVLFLAGRFNLY